MTAYYNEIDPQAAQWLRNLIAAGHIAPGDVDCRSIKDVQPHELAGYTQYHFFAGIGVWSYALRAAGWPDDRPVWTGSCPCQPFSAAGKGEGFDDPRHLWPDWFRLIREQRPLVVFGEQVAGPDGLAWLDLIHADLEDEAHAVGAVDTCSAGFGGSDIRQRLYWVADANGGRLEGGSVPVQRAHEGGGRDHVDAIRASAVGGMAHTEDGNGRRELETRGARSGRPGSSGGGPAGRVADTDCERGCRRETGGEDAADARLAGETRGLADADGWHEGDRGVQRGGQHGIPTVTRSMRKSRESSSEPT